VNRILGMGVDKAAEHVPILGAPTGWASEDIQETVMKSIEQDTTTEAEHKAGGEYSHGRSEAIRSAQDAVDNAVRHNPKIDMQTADDLQRAARTAAGISHSDGAQWNSESHH
jgi:spore coat polysaccharide biosynthesis protein SpsF (cytidylyltransferase family)